ncbi:hypothetical protein NHQ30_004018 [Ciborinia camelliae]|nr:hypothetical protein NHQ30_004018 [Ciborinia camelliae]
MDVLKKILRELLVRPAHLMPGIVREKGAFGDPPKLDYRYQWSDARQEQYERDLLPKNIGSTHIQTFWAAAPTKEEARLIEAGNNHLTTILQNGQEIEGFIHSRKDFGDQIIHRSVIPVTAISGVAILRSCKQLGALGVTLLYGENSFLFDTRGLSPFCEPQSVVTIEDLSHKPNEIPGRRRTDGSLPSDQQITRSVAKIFEQNQHRSKFISQDPLTRFFMEIGRKNASQITNIIIQGRWNWIIGKWKRTGSQPVGLHDLLPIYTIILKEACKNIHTIILHDGDLGYPQLNKLGPPKTDRDKEISESVEKLVHGLPHLRKLQLGQYKYVPAGCGYDPGVSGSKIIPRIQPNDEWRQALKWMSFVEQRAKNHVVVEASSKR